MPIEPEPFGPTRVDESLLDPPPATVRERAGGTAAGIVVAAMLGIGEVLEPEKAKAPVEIVGEAPQDEPILDLDLEFGGLPPID